ncbi:hypothetical protein [Scytonema sp. PRP1]
MGVTTVQEAKDQAQCSVAELVDESQALSTETQKIYCFVSIL